MRKLLMAGAVVALGLLMDHQAAAQVSGNYLLQTCTTKSATADHYCRGFIMGMVQGQTSETVTVPEGVSDYQLKDIVVNWLRANPAERHHEAFFVITWALWSAFGRPAKVADLP